MFFGHRIISEARLVKRSRKVFAIVDHDGSIRNALLGLRKAVGFSARAFASVEEFLN
jgi:FixJ family two-component response regulator